ncbi:MAG TPA: hypothetical protein VIJ68_02545 [Candidatus Saccharimonadales bacterium]
MKLMIFLGITIGATIGGGIGNIFDGQSPFNLFAFGGWSLVMSTIGSFVGIWAGYKAAQYIEG